MSHLTRAEAVSLFEARRKAWLDEDAETYLALWSDDMVIELPGREELRGKLAYTELIHQSFAAMRPLAWEFHRIVVDGDHVLSEWTITGELRRTGRTVTWRGMSICRVTGGLIQAWREYWDPAVLRSARA